MLLTDLLEFKIESKIIFAVKEFMSKKLNSKTAGKILVRQCKSGANFDKRTRATLVALGLGRIGKERIFTSNPAVLGQIGRIAHLVQVSDA